MALVTIPQAVHALALKYADWIPNGFAEIVDAINLIEPGREVSEETLYAQFTPVLLATGIQPVRVIWDEPRYKNACLELQLLIARGAEPTPSGRAEAEKISGLLAEHLDVWDSWRPKLEFDPYHEITMRALSNLGVGKTQSGDHSYRMTSLVLAVSGVVMDFPGPFWRQIKENYTLS